MIDSVGTLLICYSVSRVGVHSPGAGLARMITSLGRWWHPAENVWLVSTGYHLDEVRDILASQLEPGDQLLVLDIGPAMGGVRRLPGGRGVDDRPCE